MSVSVPPVPSQCGHGRCDALTSRLPYTKGCSLMPVPTNSATAAVAASPRLVPLPMLHAALAPSWAVNRRQCRLRLLGRHPRRSTAVAASEYAPAPSVTVPPRRVPSAESCAYRRAGSRPSRPASNYAVRVSSRCQRAAVRAVLRSLLPSPRHASANPFISALVARHRFHARIASHVHDARATRAKPATEVFEQPLDLRGVTQATTR